MLLRLTLVLMLIASPVAAATYYCRSTTGGKFWFRCVIIDGREICTNTRIHCS
jgi:hypothetical protein